MVETPGIGVCVDDQVSHRGVSFRCMTIISHYRSTFQRFEEKKGGISGVSGWEIGIVWPGTDDANFKDLTPFIICLFFSA